MKTISYDTSKAHTLVHGASEVVLYPRFLRAADAADLADALTSALAWQRLTSKMFGKEYAVPRDTVWVGPIAYRYSGLRHEAAGWPEALVPLRGALEDAVEGAAFETVLANRYRDGRDKVGWHADDECIFGTAPVIASISLGASRTFKLRHNSTRKVLQVELGAGSLLLMCGATQAEYQHCVPEQKSIAGQRINLTFRTLGPQS